MIKTVTCSIDDVFKNAICPPNHYQFEFFHLKKVSALFEFICQIYIRGAIILFGSNDAIELQELTPERQLILKQYMMSMGIKPVLRRYSEQDVHDVYEQLISDLHTISKSTRIQVFQSPNKLIKKIHFSFPTKTADKLSFFTALQNKINSNIDYQNIVLDPVKDGEVNIQKFSKKIKNKTNLYILRFQLL